MEEKEKGKLKEIWKDEKKRSAIKLSFYLLFIGILIVGLNTTPTKKKEEKKEEQKEEPQEVIEIEPYETLKNYEYTLEVEGHKLFGKRYLEKELITEDSEVYFFEHQKLYHVVDTYKEEIEDSLYGVSLLELRPEKLSRYFQKKYVFFEQENDGNEVDTTYRIPNVDFDILEEGFVTIDVKKKEEIVETVKIIKNGQTILITYKNQNGLKSLTLPHLKEKEEV